VIKKSIQIDLTSELNGYFSVQ